MGSLGYRTFGIGKFHSSPWNEDLGYDVHLHSEELYGSPEQRAGDAYASWLHREHPEYGHLEGLMGERTEMYYMPQMSAQPADCAVEGWAAARAVEQLAASDDRPCFGMVSFIGPHPPFAPPIPFNRMYDPDRMPDPVKGDIETDHTDQQIPRMNDMIWAESINDPHARILKARYYGEISYIDDCLGRILDAVESRADADNTLICFFSDHGDHLGDHHAWQKESFLEASTRIPFLVSWPARLPSDERRPELVCLTDLFGIATSAAGRPDVREGIDLLGVLNGSAQPRDALIGMYELPGTDRFKIMVREDTWKYIFLANGGREQLFDLKEDPNELCSTASARTDVAARLRRKAIAACLQPGARDALDGEDLKTFPFSKWEWRGQRYYQFDRSKGVSGFPESPADVLEKGRTE
jgi:choline-sulfatase